MLWIHLGQYQRRSCFPASALELAVKVRLLNVVLIKLQYLMMRNDILSLKNVEETVTISVKRL